MSDGVAARAEHTSARLICVVPCRPISTTSSPSSASSIADRSIRMYYRCTLAPDQDFVGVTMLPAIAPTERNDTDASHLGKIKRCIFRREVARHAPHLG